MRVRCILLSVALIAVGTTVVGYLRLPGPGSGVVAKYDVVQGSPRIEPDYASLVIPPNFAPLNFVIRESGTDIHDSQGHHITVKSADPVVLIPEKRWRRLLSDNRGKEICIDVYTKRHNGTWQRFSPLIDTVSRDDIDRYMVYRLMPPLYSRYGKMGIFQRCLSSFWEKPLWLNRMSGNNCMNCHTFKKNNPDYMLMHMRGGKGKGTLIKQGKKVFKLNLETAFNKPGAFPAWHPSGTLVALSVNRVRQLFHATGEPREGFDRKSKIIMYNIETNTVSSPAALHNPGEMPTQPEWSPDGSCLYYCCAPQYPEDSIAAYYGFFTICAVFLIQPKRIPGESRKRFYPMRRPGSASLFPKFLPMENFCCAVCRPMGHFRYSGRGEISIFLI
jgi:hypothetical protein